jgi:putative cell wall-binding protein
VAALTGVTLFGGLSIVGAGVASAATPTVVAAYALASPNNVPVNIAGTGLTATQAGQELTLTVTGTPVSGVDTLSLSLACPTTGTATFATSASWTAITSSNADFAGKPTITAGDGTTICSVATWTAAAAISGDVITVIPSFTTTGVTPQALTISGSYQTLGSSTSFAVPTDANVQWFSLGANTPAVTLSTTAVTSLSPISITQPTTLPTGTAITAGDTITLTLNNVNDAWSGTPTISATPALATAPAFVTKAANVATFSLGSVPSGATSETWTIGNLAIQSTTDLGAHTVTIAETNVPETLFSTVTVGKVLGSAVTIAGADGTADGTVAAEFENAYPVTAVNTGGNRNVVLATDVAHTNGSDALAASYLEGMLGTGLLITTPTTLGQDAIDAMRIEGVSTVYVVGGPLAISPAVLAQIQTLPVYNPGGLTLASPSATVKVVGPIAGADGTAEGTAAAIATYFNSSTSVGFAGAYTASGIGLYNDTTGIGSVVAPSSSVPTAIVVASTDWQDAMTIAPEAFNKHIPVILTGPSTSTTLGADAQAALTSLGIKQVILVGGNLAVQNSVEAQIAGLNSGISVLRIAGKDSTDTAGMIANFALSSSASNGLGLTAGVTGRHNVIVSHGDYWTDALGAAALGGGANTTAQTGFGFEPILVTSGPTTLGSYITAELGTLGGLGTPVTGLTVLGGPLAMPSSTVNALLAAL